jgi:hypothetical protein
MTIPRGGLFHPFAVYIDETDPVLADYYRKAFALKNSADIARLRNANEKLILSSKKNSNFSQDELLRLKAFGIREPNLEAGLKEMASLLLRSVLPEIERISAQPIPSRC